MSGQLNRVGLKSILFGLCSVLGLSAFNVSAQSGSDCANRFRANDEYRDICLKYTETNIIVLPSGADLNLEVDNAGENVLLIVPAGSYSLSKPLKFRAGQGLLPSTPSGFVRLTPASGYAIEGSMFTVYEIGENNYHGGVEVDADAFDELTAFSNASTRALVYTSGLRKFKTTWFNLKGVPDLDYVVFADNDHISATNASDVEQEVSHSYIDAVGAARAVKLDVPKVANTPNPDDYTVKVEHCVITTGSGNSNHSKVEALEIINGIGEVEHSHLVFRRNEASNNPVRELFHLEDSENIVIKENVLMSEESGSATRERDLVFDLVKSPNHQDDIRVSIEINLGTNKARSIDSSDDSVTQVIGKAPDENYQVDELVSLPTAQEFFSRGARAGLQYANRFVLQDIELAYQTAQNTSDISDRTQKAWELSGIMFINDPNTGDDPEKDMEIARQNEEIGVLQNTNNNLSAATAGLSFTTLFTFSGLLFVGYKYIQLRNLGNFNNPS